MINFFLFKYYNMVNNFNKIMVGGGLSPKSFENMAPSFELFLMSIFMLLIKGLIVMLSYNLIAPKLISNFKTQYNPQQEFRPLSFWEGILVVILFNNLFSRY